MRRTRSPRRRWLGNQDGTRRALGESFADAAYEARLARGWLDRLRVRARLMAAVVRTLVAGLAPNPGGTHPMRHLSQDFRHGVRRLRKAPAFSTFAVLTLAIAIGAVTAIYSVIAATLHSPLAVADPSRMVNIYGSDMQHWGSAGRYQVSRPDFDDLRAQQTVFTDVLAWARARATWTTEAQTVSAFGEMVTGNYFTLLGVPALHGRTLVDADDRPGAARVVVLSHDAWRRHFNSDPNIVGRTMRINDVVFEIAGVAAADFRGVDMPALMSATGWITFAAAHELALTRAATPGTPERDTRWLMVKGRLAPGATIDTAAAELNAIAARLDQAYPRVRERDRQPVPRAFTPFPSSDVLVHESIHPVARTYSNVVIVSLGLVLLVACTTLANLQLGRLGVRRAEIALRTAIGASRWRVLRELAVESGALAIAGLAGGLVVAALLMRYLTTEIDVTAGIVIRVAPRFDASVLLLAAAATLLATVVAGLIPAWHVTRASLREGVTAQATQVAARWRGRRFIIGAQVGVSAALLVVSSVFARYAWSMLDRDLGVDYAPLAAVQFDFGGGRVDEARAYERLVQVRDAVRAAPGVETAFVGGGLPIGFSMSSGTAATRPGPTKAGEGAWSYVLAATPEVTSALGLRVVAGRPLTVADEASGAPGVMVSEEIARQLFGRTDVSGRTVHLRRSRYVGREVRDDEFQATIVGVIADVDLVSPGQELRGLLVVPAVRWMDSRMVVVARMNSRAESAAWMRDLVRRLDRDLPVLEARTGESLLSAETMFARVGSVVTTSLGVAALLLGLIGLAGVLGHSVAMRTREIAIRVALGAGRDRVLRLVIRDGMRPVVIGLVLGVAAGVGTTQSLRAAFGRLGGLPLEGVVVIPAALALAGLVACFIPARRAAAIDPNVALRQS